MSARILVVDDHEVIRHGVRSVLLRARRNGKFAVKRPTEGKPLKRSKG
jgi:DNA-binding NarL/FixJ family response regulator